MAPSTSIFIILVELTCQFYLVREGSAMMGIYWDSRRVTKNENKINMNHDLHRIKG